jgi:hypothetical protein
MQYQIDISDRQNIKMGDFEKSEKRKNQAFETQGNY